MTEQTIKVVKELPIEIVAILDRSGSMGTIRDDSIGAFNTFIEEQQKESGDANITIVLFDDQYEILQDRANLADAVKFTTDNFVPRGWTALYDAIGLTLNKFKALRDEGKVDGAIFSILTDGMENYSKEFNIDTIKNMIQTAEKEYGWSFVYLGANQDAFSVGATMGFAAAACATYDATGDGVRYASTKMADDTKLYRSSYYSKKAINAEMLNADKSSSD